MRSYGAGPEETILSYEEQLRELGLISLEKALGKSHYSLPFLKESLWKKTVFLHGLTVIEQREMVLN